MRSFSSCKKLSYTAGSGLLANRGVPRQNAIAVNAFEISDNQEGEAGAGNQAIRSVTMLHPNGKSLDGVFNRHRWRGASLESITMGPSSMIHAPQRSSPSM